jgi:hypothetical protein
MKWFAPCSSCGNWSEQGTKWFALSVEGGLYSLATHEIFIEHLDRHSTYSDDQFGSEILALICLELCLEELSICLLVGKRLEG